MELLKRRAENKIGERNIKISETIHLKFPEGTKILDKDSSDSNNNEGRIKHLGRQLLAALCAVWFRNSDNKKYKD